VIKEVLLIEELDHRTRVATLELDNYSVGRVPDIVARSQTFRSATG